MAKFACFVASAALSLLILFQLQSTAEEPLPSKMSYSELEGEIKRLEREIEALRNSPDAPESWKRLVALEAEFKTKQEDFFAKIGKLSNTAESREWEQRISSLN